MWPRIYSIVYEFLCKQNWKLVITNDWSDCKMLRLRTCQHKWKTAKHTVTIPHHCYSIFLLWLQKYGVSTTVCELIGRRELQAHSQATLPLSTFINLMKHESTYTSCTHYYQTIVFIIVGCKTSSRTVTSAQTSRRFLAWCSNIWTVTKAGTSGHIQHNRTLRRSNMCCTTRHNGISCYWNRYENSVMIRIITINNINNNVLQNPL